ncbi:hypothetical protein EDD17DRAFT_1764745 [Pisolithus thermaeus]|nr:hypothetical protein EV401DRAFT_2083038 [Pisolithus croceorrhizus]KAI6154491.1 hypothetical protein EDD17DRAFT_1764745 [Pisolithus thermaeus]
MSVALTRTLLFSWASSLFPKVIDTLHCISEIQGLSNILATKEHSSDTAFRMFRRQLFHSSLSMILDPLKLAMTSPEVVKFGDGYYRRVIYGLGPYIADYEEQALLACIVRGWCARCQATRKNLDDDALLQCREFTEALLREAANSLAILWDEYGIVGDLVPFTNDFPHADIHQLIAPDILHQLIKGCFKDHLVDWVETYLKTQYGTKEAERILDDIDRRIAAIAPFTGLRRFPQGRGFKQWTGDDSKALMKVYLPAIKGHVPAEIVRTFRAFLEFSYLFNAIGQMLLTNQRLDKLVSCRIDFASRGMLEGTCLSAKLQSLRYLAPAFSTSNSGGAPGSVGEPAPLTHSDAQPSPPVASTQADNEEGIPDDLPMSLTGHVELARTRQGKRARTIEALAVEIGVPNLGSLLSQFLFYQQHPNDRREPAEIPLTDCPRFEGSISVFNSASARFYAPSDLSGLGGMRTEFIRSAPLWRNEAPRYDCVFVGTNSTDPSETGMQAYEVARVFSFFSFKYKGVRYPCAVIRWFDKIGDGPDEDTGMWMVRPSFLPNRSPNFSIIHTDAIYRAVHLIPVYGDQFISRDIRPHHSYDTFHAFYVNKYADHHAFEIAG